MPPLTVVYDGAVSNTGDAGSPTVNDESLNDAGLLPAMLSYDAPAAPEPPRVVYCDACACWKAPAFVFALVLVLAPGPRELVCA